MSLDTTGIDPAVLLAALIEVAQPRHFGLAGGHYHLPADLVRHAVLLAESLDGREVGGADVGVTVRNAGVAGQHVHGSAVAGQFPRHGVFTGPAAEEYYGF